MNNPVYIYIYIYIYIYQCLYLRVSANELCLLSYFSNEERGIARFIKDPFILSRLSDPAMRHRLNKEIKRIQGLIYISPQKNRSFLMRLPAGEHSGKLFKDTRLNVTFYVPCLSI